MENAVDDYLAAVASLTSRLAGTDRAMLAAAAKACAQAILADRVIWLFGAGHGQCLALELHHRAGVPACFVPMASPLLAFAEGALMETVMERLPAMAPALVKRYRWQAGDVLVAISTSGTTPLTVEVARLAKHRRLKVIAVGSPRCAASRPDKQSMFEHADHILDNGAPEGDAVVELAPLTRCGALSGLSGALILQLLALLVCEALLLEGVDPPIWRSSALPGADSHNDQLAAVWWQRNRCL